MVNEELQPFSLFLLSNIQGDSTVMLMLTQEKPVCGDSSKKLCTLCLPVAMQDLQLFNNLHAKNKDVGGFIILFLVVFFCWLVLLLLGFVWLLFVVWLVWLVSLTSIMPTYNFWRASPSYTLSGAELSDFCGSLPMQDILYVLPKFFT